MASHVDPDSRSKMVDHSHFKPFVSSATILPEFTLRTVILGSILGVIFGASSVYLALKVGLTVSASIPIAVLSITIFRAFGRASILENNMVQTIGSAGESVAAGVVFTIPALLIMGYSLEISRVALIALTGGWLGVLMMIPLRRALIVKEHGKLTYPEGTACAEVLIVGEEGGSQAKTVFSGFGLGIIYKVLMSGLHLWKEVPEKVIRSFPGASISAEVSPELMGVGYIIGPKVASVMLAGAVLAYLVLMPAIKFFGSLVATPLFPGTIPIAEMTSDQLRDAYILYVGAGAVATGGIISLLRSMPMILSAFRSSLGGLKAGLTGGVTEARTERDLSMNYVLFGCGILVLVLAFLPQLQLNFFGAVLILAFGFFFVTVSSRITGEIGASSNPISGMTVATILLTCIIFLFIGKTGAEWRVVALSVGAVVCISASIGGATSQDLKTGFLVGATPKYQQMGLMIGVTGSAIAIGWVLFFLNESATIHFPKDFPQYTATSNFVGTQAMPGGKSYRIHSIPVATNGILPGRYLVDESGKIRYSIDPGVGGRESTQLIKTSGKVAENAKPMGTMRGLDGVEYQHVAVTAGEVETQYLVDEGGQIQYKFEPRKSRYDAPKATLMALIIDGILTQKLPWSLVLLGVFISITLELCGVAALPFAVGLYLPFSTSSPIFIGGVVRYLVDLILARQGKAAATEAEAESGNGVLFSSGLIAGGAMGGLLVAALNAFKIGEHALAEKINVAEHFEWLEHGTYADLTAIVFFALIGIVLWKVGQQTSPNKVTE
ncbi:MAG TPA: oligopeptide transporter, OPT family [Acidobacteriota bacterium]|nr:oligopeptide transporter, OPT family [Acidobacteriota bacterium]